MIFEYFCKRSTFKGRSNHFTHVLHYRLEVLLIRTSLETVSPGTAFTIMFGFSAFTIYGKTLRRQLIIITSLFRKLTKISTNNFKMNINGISDPLEVCKNTISA